MSKNLENRCKLLNRLFADLMATDSRTDKEIIVNNFRNKWPQMTKDLDLEDNFVSMGLGWLSREDKISYTRKPKSISVRLV